MGLKLNLAEHHPGENSLEVNDQGAIISLQQQNCEKASSVLFILNLNLLFATLIVETFESQKIHEIDFRE